MKRLLTLALALASLVANSKASPILSEFLASNAQNLATADDKTEDWIEIQNTGAAAINLAGYHLTDDPEQPQRWAFPAVDLAPGAFLVVFASGDDLKEVATDLHTNFRLNRDGGYLALTGGDGAVVSAFEAYPPQRTDVSYGMAGSDPLYFESPTPGEANGTTGLLGFVADTKFSVDRGYFEEAFQVEITTAMEDVRILYTTDGRAPSKGNIFSGVVGEDYTGPITIDTTTTLRAIAMKDGFRSSNVDTQTYLFLADVPKQTGEQLIDKWGDTWGGTSADYEMDPRVTEDARWKDTLVEDLKTLPVLSITVEPEQFFSLNKGIYPGKIGQDGIDIPASAELLHPDGKEGFQIDCAVRIVGQSSPARWKIKKLSMRLRFSKEYGPGMLRYPLYDDPTAVEEFNTLTVDARHNNTWAYDGPAIPAQQREWAQYLRDQTAADLHRAMGGSSPHGRYVYTFVNGIFWGMYNIHERPDDAFNASYQGGEREDWVVTRHGDPGNGGVSVSGNAIRLYRDLNSLAEGADDPDVYAQIEAQLDIDDFINYIVINVGLGNGDWGHKNYYASLSPIDGKWRFHSWDAEKVFQSLDDDLSEAINNPGPTGIHHSLTKNPEYRIRFADAIYKHFYNGGVMSTEGLQRIYKRRTDEIDRAVVLESARWGDAATATPHTKEDWDTERDRLMTDYFVNRPDIAVEQFEDRGLFSDVDLPKFENHGGHFESGHAVKIKKSIFARGTLYYTTDGSDPRLPGGDLSDAAIKYADPIALEETTTIIKARLLGSKEWSALVEATFVIGAAPATAENLVVKLINYHPAGASDEEKAAGYSRKDFEFIGLTNVSDANVSLLGLNLIDGIRFDFDQAAVMEVSAGATVFLVKNQEAFAARYGADFTVAGVYEGSLSNDGERLLLESDGTTVADFAFNDNAKWPTGTDGDGAYLVLLEPGAGPDSNMPASWRASTAEDSPAGAASEGGGGENPGGGALTYASWSASAFEAGATLTGPNEDADGDDFTNYLEYVMGGDPTDPSSTPSLTVEPQEDGLPIFGISHRVGVAEDFALETGRTLDSWTLVDERALSVLDPLPGPDASTEIRRYRVLQLTKDAVWTERFVRVRADVPVN